MSSYVGHLHKILEQTNSATPQRCLYHNREGKRCKADAIGSHTIQKNGPLATIAEDGHVVKVGPLLRAQPVEKRSLFERIGVNKASIFPGYCNEHDTQLFSGIEVANPPLSKSTGVLLSIRAISLELYKKMHMVELQKSTILHLISEGKTDLISTADAIKRGATWAVENNYTKLKELFRWHHNEPPKNFHCVAYLFDGHAPFSATGAFEPFFTLRNKFTFLNDPNKTKWNSVTVFDGNYAGGFLSFYCGLQKYKDHRVDWFLRSIDSIKFSPSLAMKVALSYTENAFLRESWLNTLSAEAKSCIEELAISGVVESAPMPDLMSTTELSPELPIREKFVSW